jgi:hypothetical protein
MIARVILGILLGYLILAYYPIILRRGLPYVLMLIMAAAAFYCLRAAPALAEPLGYGILAALLFYAVFLILRHKGHLKELAQKAKSKKLPVVNIPNHPQISMIITLIAYTIGLTFISYLVILLVCVH